MPVFDIIVIAGITIVLLIILGIIAISGDTSAIIRRREEIYIRAINFMRGKEWVQARTQLHALVFDVVPRLERERLQEFVRVNESTSFGQSSALWMATRNSLGGSILQFKMSASDTGGFQAQIDSIAELLRWMEKDLSDNFGGWTAPPDVRERINIMHLTHNA